MSTRATEPLPPQLSSAAPKPWAEMLFQLAIVPSGGSMPWMCLSARQEACHSYFPLPTVGRPGSTVEGRSGSMPLVYSATCWLSM